MTKCVDETKTPELWAQKTTELLVKENRGTQFKKKEMNDM